MDSDSEHDESSSVEDDIEDSSFLWNVIWGMLTIVYTIVVMITFVSEAWLTSKKKGSFGMWSSCHLASEKLNDFECIGEFGDLDSITNIPFKITVFLIGGAALLAVLTVFAFLLFFFLTPEVVLYFCGTLENLSGVFLLTGVLIFPLGWNTPRVREICGPRATIYNPGDCQVNWTYILAVVGFINAFIFANLAAILSRESAEIEAELRESLNKKDN